MQDGLTSHAPKKDRRAFYQSLVSRVSTGVAAAVGESNIRALLMIGAPARGEATVVETPEGPYSLSDIDLVGLVSPGADLASVKARAAQWVPRANEELSEACTGIDVSFRTVDELRRLFPSISNFEMLRSPAVVWGDPSAASALPTIGLADVPAWDALVLVHNRIVEELLTERMLDLGPTSLKASLAALYAAGKLVLDAVTALLFVEREVPETYIDRVRVFSTELLERPANRRLKEACREFLPDLEAWSRFKSDGDLARLARFFDSAADAEGIARLPHRLRDKYSRLAGTIWRAVLGRVVGRDVLNLPLREVLPLFGRLESPVRSAVRALKALRSPAGQAGLYSTRRVLARAPFASPRYLAYMTAVVLYLGTSDGPDGAATDRLVRAYCPFPLGRHGTCTDGDARRALLESLAQFHKIVLKGRR